MTSPYGGARHWRCFPHSSHFDTEMMGFKKNGYAMGMQHGFQSICNLVANPLLYRKTLRKEPY